MKKEKAIVIFGEGLETNVGELNKLYDEGWKTVIACAMPSAASVAIENSGGRYTKFYEPQCLVILQKFEED